MAGVYGDYNGYLDKVGSQGGRLKFIVL